MSRPTVCLKDGDLTGRVRVRVQRRWGRQELVMQVEYKYTHYGYVWAEPATAWRDAQVTDFDLMADPWGPECLLKHPRKHPRTP